MSDTQSTAAAAQPVEAQAAAQAAQPVEAQAAAPAPKPKRPKAKSLIMIGEQTDALFASAKEAKARGEMVGWSASIFPQEIADTASSFALETGTEIGRAAFTASIWKRFEEEYGKFIKAGSLLPLKARYEEGLVNRGRFVKVLDPQEPFTGTARGITDTGDLIVAPEDGGPERIVSSGEVSVRGVNGYV